MAARDKELAVLRAQLAGGASATAPGPASSDGHSSGTQHGEEHEAQVRSPCSLYAPGACRANSVVCHVFKGSHNTVYNLSVHLRVRSVVSAPRACVCGCIEMQWVSMQGSAPRVLPRSKLSDAELAACRVQYDALVSAMRELATRHSLNVANVLGERVRQHGSCLLQAASPSLAACLCCCHSKSIQTAIPRRPHPAGRRRGALSCVSAVSPNCALTRSRASHFRRRGRGARGAGAGEGAGAVGVPRQPGPGAQGRHPGA